MIKALFLYIFTLHLFANELSWVNEQINAIEPKRVGVNEAQIDLLKDPGFYLYQIKTDEKNELNPLPDAVIFSTKKEKKKKSIAKPTLHAIINKSVLLNKQWYKIGDKVETYKIIDIKKDFVILKCKNESIKLAFHKNNRNISIDRKQGNTK